MSISFYQKLQIYGKGETIRQKPMLPNYVNHLKSGDRIPDNNGIYEAAMEVTFGKNIWNELKKYW